MKQHFRLYIRQVMCLVLCVLCMGAFSYDAYAASIQVEEKKETIEDIYNNNQELDPFTDPEKFAERFGLTKEGDFDPKEIDYFYYNRSFYVTITDKNVYDVTELVDVYFHSTATGITRTLPRYNPVADLNGVKTMGYPEYSGISSDSPMTITETDSDITIKLGDEKSSYKGFEQFRLHYTLDLGPDVLSGRDEALLYIIPPSADRPTLRCQFEIQMPKAFDEDEITFVCGDKSKEDILTYSVDGTKITGETDYHIDANRSVVFRLRLPDGYFSDASRSYDIPALISLGATTLMAIICMILYMYSRSRNKETFLMDFYPPKELNPAEAAYLKFGKLTDKKMALLIPYLAARGSFKVTEISKGGTKLDRNSVSYTYTKSDEMPGMHPDERMIVEGIFGKKKKAPDSDEPISVDDTSLKGRLYYTLGRINEYALEDKTSVYNTLFTAGGKYMRIIYRAVLYLLTIIGIALPLSFIGNGDDEHFSYWTFAFVSAGIIAGLLLIGLFPKPVKAPIAAALIGLSVYFMPTNSHVMYPHYIAAVTSLSAALILNVFANDIKMVRSHYGKRLYDRLMGFERFMKTCDTHKIKSLCEKDKDYLYNMLPFTQALEINLPRNSTIDKEYLPVPPEWYVKQDYLTGFGYYNMMYYYDTMIADVTYVPSGASSFDVSQIPPQILSSTKKQ
ncbi:DUF2207 domain-containing protein [Ruminococcus sp. NK3A76]|uniref:DUF2207 family protein n=1 Tax=Ruminococcus sp. NK3A76 TaxID=877411 RepID=UPI00048B5C45|nr:DUF2207 domain-containing protein [Ruminococcus sp. NK3A76]